MTRESIAEVAAGLTKAQRRIVTEMPADAHFIDAYVHCRQRRTRMALNNNGVTEPMHNSAMTVWWMIRLTPLGRAIRAHLISQGADQ